MNKAEKVLAVLADFQISAECGRIMDAIGKLDLEKVKASIALGESISQETTGSAEMDELQKDQLVKKKLILFVALEMRERGLPLERVRELVEKHVSRALGSTTKI